MTSPPYILHTHSSHSSLSSANSGPRSSNMRAVFGSLRERLNRKPNSPPVSPTTTMAPKEANPFRGSAGRNTDSYGAASSSGSGPSMNRNPMLNPSPATRRPVRKSRLSFVTDKNHICNTSTVAIEPPPAYTPSPTAESGPTLPAVTPPYTPRSASPAPSNASRITVTTAEDPYAFLSSFDTIFVVDDSGSMAGRSWREVKQALRAITPICTSHDADGIDLYFLNHRSDDRTSVAGKAAGGFRNVTSSTAIESIFSRVRPGGGTPTGQRLQSILRQYLRQLETATRANGGDVPDADVIKPVNIIVITDGIASDDVESVVEQAARKLDKLDAPPYQVGIQFFQVGNEPGARQALQSLDDELAARSADGVRDMVDTVTWSENDLRAGSVPELTSEAILKTVLGAVVRRLDRREVPSASSCAPENNLSVAGARRRQ